MRSKRKTDLNSIIADCLNMKRGTRSILYIPDLAEETSIPSAIFLAQLLYWVGKGEKSKSGWIYKTVEEMQKETCLSRGQQDRAIKAWKERGVLKVKLMGVPARRHFSVNVYKIVDYLNISEQFDEYVRMCGLKDLIQFAQNEQTNTEITQRLHRV